VYNSAFLVGTSFPKSGNKVHTPTGASLNGERNAFAPKMYSALKLKMEKGLEGYRPLGHACTGQQVSRIRLSAAMFKPHIRTEQLKAKPDPCSLSFRGERERLVLGSVKR